MIEIKKMEELIKKRKERIQLIQDWDVIKTKLIRIEGVIMFLEEKIRIENEEKKKQESGK